MSRSSVLASPRRALPLVALALAGCGGEKNASESGAGAAVRVVEADFANRPVNVRIDRAGKVAFRVVNEGRSEHALAIETPGGPVASASIAPGQSGTLEADLQTGSYTWYCPVGNHRGLGMRGRLTVGQADGAASPTPEPDSDRSPGY